MNIASNMQRYTQDIESFLKLYTAKLDESDVLVQSMNYSLFCPGKRIRPIIMLAFYELGGGESKEIYKFAAAVEMIHTYSLVHDDLPCMDDSDIRRGKPANHKVYGIDTALLAGDALLTYAFEVASSAEFHDDFSGRVLEAMGVLARAAGPEGMALGQSLDLNNKNWNKNKVLNLHKLKTAALISASAEIGAILSGASHSQILSAKNYGEKIGICFQLIDDILDGDDKILSFFTEIELRNFIDELTKNACDTLSVFEGNISFLSELPEFLKFRKN